MDKLETLAQIEGLDVDTMLERATFDSVTPGICINDFCEYTCEVEPDCRNGWCEECGEGSVQSCLVLAEII